MIAEAIFMFWFDLRQTRTSGLNHVAWFILHCLVFREHLAVSAAHRLNQLLYLTSFRIFCQASFFDVFHTAADACSFYLMKQCRAPEPLHHHWPCCVRWRLVLYYTLSAHLSTLFLKKAYSFFKLFQIWQKPAWREQKDRCIRRCSRSHDKMVGRDGFEPS